MGEKVVREKGNVGERKSKERAKKKARKSRGIFFILQIKKLFINT